MNLTPTNELLRGRLEAFASVAAMEAGDPQHAQQIAISLRIMHRPMTRADVANALGEKAADAWVEAKEAMLRFRAVAKAAAQREG